jgi:hypothetical protein
LTIKLSPFQPTIIPPEKPEFSAAKKPSYPNKLKVLFNLSGLHLVPVWNLGRLSIVDIMPNLLCVWMLGLFSCSSLYI